MSRRPGLLLASSAPGGWREVHSRSLEGGLGADIFQFGCLAGCMAHSVKHKKAHRILDAHASQRNPAIFQDPGDAFVGALVLLPDAYVVADFDEFTGAH